MNFKISIFVKYFVFVLGISFFATSCSSTKQYGYKNDRINKSRNKNSRIGEYSNTRITKRSSSTKSRKSVLATSGNRASANSRKNMVSYANKYKGIPYNYGGKTPSQGFDCSGFVTYVFKNNGKPIYGASRDLAKMGTKKKRSELESGDLLFFGRKNKVTHVGMVYSNKNNDLMMIHSSSSKGIVVESIENSSYWNSRFLFGRDLIDSTL